MTAKMPRPPRNLQGIQISPHGSDKKKTMNDPSYSLLALGLDHGTGTVFCIKLALHEFRDPWRFARVTACLAIIAASNSSNVDETSPRPGACVLQ